MTGIPVAPGELVDIGYLNEVARAHYRKTTAKAVVNTVVETDLLNGEVTIGAGAMSTNRALRLTAWGDLVNNTGATQASYRVKAKLGATTLIDSNTVAASWLANAGRFPWRCVVEVLNLGAANAQWVSFAWEHMGAVAAGASGLTTGEGDFSGTVATGSVGLLKANGCNAGAVAVDTTVAQVLALTTTLPVANALLDVTLKGAVVELV